MTVEPTYRHCTHDEQPMEAEADLCNLCLPWLGFVPDIRLQSIADAWNSGESVGRWHANAAMRKASFRKDWPELAGLLDALTKENSE